MRDREIIGSNRGNSRDPVGLSRGGQGRVVALCRATRKIRTRVPFNRTPCRNLHARKVEKEEQQGKRKKERESAETVREEYCKKEIPKKSCAIKSENRSTDIDRVGRDWFHLLQDALQKVPMCIRSGIKCELCRVRANCTARAVLSLSLSVSLCRQIHFAMHRAHRAWFESQRLNGPRPITVINCHCDIYRGTYIAVAINV